MSLTKMAKQDQIQTVLKDTIVLLCQNGLHFQSEFNVEALVAITVDQNEVLLVSIKETVRAKNTDGQPSNMVPVDRQEVALDTDVKPQFSSMTSSFVEQETNHNVCDKQQCRSTSDVIDSVASRMIENDNDSHLPTDQSSNVCLKPLLSTENLDTSAANSSGEALDLTDSVRRHTTKRKHCVLNSIPVGDKLQSNDPGETGYVQDMDDCSESSSVVCIKDEMPALDDVDTDCLSSFDASVAAERNCLHKRSRQSSSSHVGANGSLLTEDAIHAMLPRSDQVLTDVDVNSVCLAIIAYSGWCVPVRDIQRLRLRGVSSSVIRTAMEILEKTGLGLCQELTGNMCIFYKCPPHLVTMEALDRWHITKDGYSSLFTLLPALNQTNKHTESYWQRVALNSPYNYH